MLAVTLGGSKDEPSAVEERKETTDKDATRVGGSVAPEKHVTMTAGSGSDVLEQNMVSLVIESEPSGADILIAGAKVGVTPFNKKFKRGMKVQELTLRKTGYVDFVAKVDLSSDYENKSIKLLTVDEAAKAGETGSGAPRDSATPVVVGPNGNGSGATNGATSGGATGAATTGATKTDTAMKATTGATSGAAAKTGTGTTNTTGTNMKTGTGTTSTSGTVTKTSTTGVSTTTKTGTTGASTATTKTGTTSTTGTKTGTQGTGTKTTTGTGTTAKKPKCQPPGPNVDPFGLPVCKS